MFSCLFVLLSVAKREKRGASLLVEENSHKKKLTGDIRWLPKCDHSCQTGDTK